MRNFVSEKQLVLVSGFALIAIGMASVAEAGGNLDAHLRGEYAFTTARTCTVSSLPFVAPTFAIPAGASVFRQSAVDSGIVTYNGDGTGTRTLRSSTMNITNTGGSPLGISEVTNAFDYTVNPDGTVDTTSTSTTFETVLGGGVGNTGTVSGQVGRLQISQGNKVLVSAPQQQIALETQVITPPGGTSFTQYRICVRSTTQTKLTGQ